MLPETQGPEKTTTAVKTVPLAPPFLVVSSLQLIDPSWMSAGTGAREMQGSTPPPPRPRSADRTEAGQGMPRHTGLALNIEYCIVFIKVLLPTY